MTKKTIYTDEPLGDIKVIADFLPSPAELAFREEGVKVTLALSKSSVDFFKAEAQAAKAVTGRTKRTTSKRTSV